MVDHLDEGGWLILGITESGYIIDKMNKHHISIYQKIWIYFFILKKTMEIILESTGIKVKGNCVIQELQPLQKIMLETINSERSKFQIDLS